MALNFFVSTPVEAQPGADTFPPLHHFCNHRLKSYTFKTTGRSVWHQQGLKYPMIQSVFDESGNLNQIIHTGFSQEDDVDNDNEPENNQDDCNEIKCRSEDYAEGDSDEEEETLVAVE